MDLFGVLALLGGLAFFLYGMQNMSSGLTKLAGGQLESVLGKMTSNTYNSLALGAVATAAIQSSSALTVILVGLVNSSILSFKQSIGIIMGSNIGTTITAWILSLVGLENDNLFVKMLKPVNFSMVFALVGILLIMNAKRSKNQTIGETLVSFAVLMYGMKMMGDAVEPLAEMPEFQNVLLLFSNPILGVIIGAVFTAVIQSSSASVGILQAFALTGAITYSTAIPIIMGQNIGTCVTAVISSIGANTSAKRVAAVHVTFNLIGTTVFLILYYIISVTLKPVILGEVMNVMDIAIYHSVFNIATTVMLLPFTGMLQKIACMVIKDDKPSEKSVMIDERLLLSPAIAVAECNARTVEMAHIAKENFALSMSIIKKYDAKKSSELTKKEHDLDGYEDALGTFLVKLSCLKLTGGQSREITKCLHSIGDFERIGDHSMNIMETAQSLFEKNLSFSKDALGDIDVVNRAVSEILDITIDAFEKNDLDRCKYVEPLEQVIDELVSEAKSRHIARLQNGGCTIELGFLFSEYLTSMERISDHCSNVAIGQIELAKSSLDMHSHNEKIQNEPEFRELIDSFRKKYKKFN